MSRFCQNYVLHRIGVGTQLLGDVTSSSKCNRHIYITTQIFKYWQVTTRACNLCKISPSNPMVRGHTIYMDILSPMPGLSSSTNFKFLLWLVDRTSCYAFITGLHDCTTESLIDGINRFTAPTSHPVLIEFDIQKIKADSGTQFTSAEF